MELDAAVLVAANITPIMHARAEHSAKTNLKKSQPAFDPCIADLG
jgi:hypothetical protein